MNDLKVQFQLLINNAKAAGFAVFFAGMFIGAALTSLSC